MLRIFARFIAFLFSCLFLTLHSAFAQEAGKNATLLAEYCYRFQFKSADSLMAVIEKPSGGVKTAEVFLLKANMIWWNLISGNDSKKLRDDYYKALYAAEKHLEVEADGGYSYIYKNICLYGYLARMDGLNKNYLKAFFQINNCFKYLEESFGNEEQYQFFYLSSGLYNYYMVTSAKKYPVIIPYLYFYPRGDLNKGFQYLEYAAGHKNKLLSTEANYFLMKIHLEDGRYAQSLIYSDRLTQLYPANGLFLYYRFHALLKGGKISEAKEVLKKMYEAADKNPELTYAQSKYFTVLAEKELAAYPKQ